MKKAIAVLFCALLLAVAAAKHFYNKSVSFQKAYAAEKESHDKLKLKRKQEDENANRLCQVKKESYNNQKDDYRHWADSPLPNDFKLLMRKAVPRK